MKNNQDLELNEIENEVEAAAADFFKNEADEEVTEFINRESLRIMNENSRNNAVVSAFLADQPAKKRELLQAIISHATYDKFPAHAEFVADEGLEENGIHGFYTFDERVNFHGKYKDLFKAAIAEEADNLCYRTVLDWYIRLDYPTYQMGTTEGFELTNELMAQVFVDLDDSNAEYDGMVDALVREVLSDASKAFVKFVGR